ncbi:MAG: hypothetical protein AAF518_24285 [Spirochaetota bacterium]
MTRSFLLLFLIFTVSLTADPHYNIRGFFGDRATGMAGAFTAISDDPSGAIYNPAGLGFSYYNYMSNSSINFSENVKEFEKVNGWSQSYKRRSSGIAPNFIGSMNRLGDFMFAMSIFNQQTENYDQSDVISRFISVPFIDSVRAQYTEQNTNYTFGPSIAYKFSERFSLGFSLFGFIDSTRISLNSFTQFMDNTYSNQTYDEMRSTSGILPVLGLQYMLSEKVFLGLSLRRPLGIKKSLKVTSRSLTNDSTDSSRVNVFNLTETQSEGYVGLPTFTDSTQQLLLLGNATLSGGIPEPIEVRTGFAFFINPKLTISVDWIHTAAYRLKNNNILYEPSNNVLLYQSDEFRELRTIETNNYALGLEYYLTEHFVVRMGSFSNFSNVKRIDWLENTIQTGVRASTFGGTLPIVVNDLTILYTVPAVQQNERDEYLNALGYSFGLGWETSGSAIALNIVQQSGRGLGVPADDAPTAILDLRAVSIYLSATIRN